MSKNRFVEFVLLSSAIHFLLLYVLFGDFIVNEAIPMLTGDTVDVYVVSPEMERQIIALDEQTGTNDKDPNARYLSRFNNKVDQETRARAWGKPFNKKVQVVQSILSEDLDNAIGNYMKRKKSTKGGQAGERNYSDARESSTYDYLPDVKEGEITSLNTAEFVYYSFYRRVEDSIVYLWNRYINEYISTHPDVRKNLSNRDYITEVEAVLDGDGHFVRMYTIRSSGIAGIDAAPGKAFAQASPFQNPPRGMIAQDNTVRMRWRFIVSIVEQIRGNMQQLDYYSPYQQGYPDPALQRQIY